MLRAPGQAFANTKGTRATPALRDDAYEAGDGRTERDRATAYRSGIEKDSGSVRKRYRALVEVIATRRGLFSVKIDVSSRGKVLLCMWHWHCKGGQQFARS